MQAIEVLHPGAMQDSTNQVLSGSSYLSKPAAFRMLSLISSQGTRSDQKACRSVSTGCPVFATGLMHARLTASKSGIASRLIVSGDPQFLHLFRWTLSELLNLCRSPPLVHRKPA